MKVLKHLNNISEELLKTIPPLKDGQTATFKLISGGQLISKSSMINGLRTADKIVESFGSTRTIKLMDRIKDPYKKAGEQYVDIGVPDQFENDRMIRPKKFILQAPGENEFLNGYFTLSGNSIDDVEMYEYFMLCNQNESNPNRDKSVEPTFKYVDYTADAQKEDKEIEKLTVALRLASEFTIQEARVFAASMNWNLADENLKSKIKKYAKENPVDFLERQGDPNLKDKMNIKLAMDHGIINYDASQHRIVWGESNTTVAILEREEGKSPVDLFFDWTEKVKNGKDVLKGISKKLTSILREAQLQTDGAE